VVERQEFVEQLGAVRSHGALRPRARSSAKALLLTVLGEFVLPHRGTVWTRTVIQSLEQLGIEERNARQALARLADHGFIASERSGRRALWRLTPDGLSLLASGAERIYSFGESNDDWDEQWVVVLCSVPERHRANRHQLQSRLAFAGFGSLGQGIAITPHGDREALANDVVRDLDLTSSAVVLRARAGELVPAEALLHRAWDLDALGRQYRAFVATFERRSPRSDAGRFTALAELVHAWRRFPFIDPEIPDRLLPASWPGRRAKAVFDDRHNAWSAAANRVFVALERDNGS
jgi:phenylacetic acid degradation operon negative regulatory protein